MELLKSGKTKDVYDNGDGTYTLAFKDDATGANGVADPGANQVGLSIKGKAKGGVRLSKYFFEQIEAAGIPTHFISADVDTCTMVVRPAQMFGEGLEFVCRIYADGSYVRRYGKYVNKGDYLDYLMEVTLKDDDRDDPLANEDSLYKLGLMVPGEYEIFGDLTEQVTKIIEAELAVRHMVLWDIKLEFGRDKDGNVLLIDDISTDCWRVKDMDGNSIDPLELVERFFGDAE